MIFIVQTVNYYTNFKKTFEQKMKKQILIFILLFSLSKQLFAVSNHSGSSTNNSSDCRMAFIHTVFASSDSIKTYRGQEGYLSFVEEHFPKLNMSAVFNYVSQALPKKEFKELGWQRYQGTVIDFLRERSRILYDGKIREEFIGLIGLEGYAQYAEKHHDSQMKRAFDNVSAVLSKAEMKELGWQQYQGTARKFREERSRLFNEQDRLRKEFIGPEGYAQYAEKHHDSQMHRAFDNVSAVLSKAEMEILNWQRYQGTVKQFREERGRLLNEQNEESSRILNEQSGERNRLFNEQGRLREEFIGPEGYANYAKTYHDSQMKRAFDNVSAVLLKAEMKELGWQKYQGTARKFRKERGRLFNEQGRLKKEFIGPEGYANYAEKHHDSKMARAFQNVSAVLLKVEMKELGWQQYQGTVKQFREERGRLFNEQGRLRNEFIGMEGYARYAETHHDSQMARAFRNISAVLSKAEMKELGWQQYQGTVKQFREERGRLFNEQGGLREEFIGPEGYAQYAETYHDSQMKRAFQNVSVVLSKAEMKELGWRQYQGTVREFHEERGRLFNEQGRLREEFIGLESYARHAETYHDSQMARAFINVSAVLSKAEMKSLNWQKYQGTVREFREERNCILNEHGEARKESIGLEGYAKYAETYHDSQMERAFINVSAVLSKVEMKELGWQKYQGTAREFREERGRLFNEQGGLKEEFMGPEGYAQYAKKHHDSQMQRAFINVSAVLSKAKMKKLSWKLFQGTTEQFYQLRDYFKAYKFEDYQGHEGQRKIAVLIFKGSLRAAYMNVSTLREYLFSNKDEFKDLRQSGWSETLK